MSVIFSHTGREAFGEDEAFRYLLLEHSHIGNGRESILTSLVSEVDEKTSKDAGIDLNQESALRLDYNILMRPPGSNNLRIFAITKR